MKLIFLYRVIQCYISACGLKATDLKGDGRSRIIKIKILFHLQETTPHLRLSILMCRKAGRLIAVHCKIVQTLRHKVQSRRLKCASHVVRMRDTSNTNTILIRNHCRQRPFGRGKLVLKNIL